MAQHLVERLRRLFTSAATPAPRQSRQGSGPDLGGSARGLGGVQVRRLGLPRRDVSRRFGLVRVVALVGVMALVLAACDWTQFRYGPAHTGFNATETAISPGNVSKLALGWTAVTGGPISASPAVANGVAYASSSDGKLYAFDAAGVTNCSGSPATCAPLWTALIGGGSTPAVDHGVVYVGSSDGKLYAFDAAGVTNCRGTPKTCTPIWTAATGGPLGAPTLYNRVVYVNSDHLYAFDAAGVTNCGGTPKTCAPLWTSIGSPYQGANAPPAVTNGVAYVTGFGELVAFDAAGVTKCSGTPKTCVPLGWGPDDGAVGSPAVANGIVYVHLGSGYIAAFDAAGLIGCTPNQCHPLWADIAGNGANFSSSLAVTNGVVYVGAGDGNLYAFDAAGGDPACLWNYFHCPLWHASTGGPVSSVFSPSVANGVVYVGSADHNLYAFDASGCGSTACSALWSATTGSSVTADPIVANGVVYVGSDKSLYAYRLP
jgi:outer membrane protein assembly factor BamB